MDKNHLWLLDYLNYDPDTGRVYTKTTNKTIVANEDGLCYVYDIVKGKNIKFKLDKVAYFLAYKKMPTDEHRILHKNLDEKDNTLKNLRLVHKTVFFKIKEARKNLEHGIKMNYHPTDQFSYVITWVENHRERTKTIADVIDAQRFLLKIKLHYSKILTKYCVFD